MKSRSIILSSVLLLSSLISLGQTIPIEAVYSNKDYRYQHFFFKELKPSSPVGFFQTSSMYVFHDKELETEIMSQSYLAYKINQKLTVLAGTFYANVPGFSASTGLQYRYAKNDLFVLLAPRIDLMKNPSYELLVVAEYRPAISKQLNLYSRLQMLGNYTRDTHNRGYQNLRIGVGNKTTQGGFAMNYDQYGPEVHTVLSMGFFLRYELGRL